MSAKEKAGKLPKKNKTGLPRKQKKALQTKMLKDQAKAAAAAKIVA